MLQFLFIFLSAWLVRQVCFLGVFSHSLRRSLAPARSLSQCVISTLAIKILYELLAISAQTCHAQTNTLAETPTQRPAHTHKHTVACGDKLSWCLH